MADELRWLSPVLSGALLLGCSAETSAPEPTPEVAVISAALSVCDEMVPATRNIDGIPSYAQCPASENSAIYSNNGVDTATTQMGADWVRTQYSGGYQCTELAHRYLYFKWDINWVPRGNAGEWCESAPPASIGIVKTMEPVHGDVMVLAPGSCGASASTGHATVVDAVDPSGRLTVVEQNRAARGTYQLSCAKCFWHVVANDGTAVTGGAGSSAAAGAGGAPSTPQAGSMAPAMPPMQTPPPTTPPATTPPPAMQPTTPPAVPMTPTPVPAAPVAAAGSSATVPMAGAPAMPPAFFTPQQNDKPTAVDPSCSVGRGAGSAHGAPYPAAFVVLALAALHGRRRRRASVVA